MNPVATSDAAFRGGACPTPEYTIAYTGNYTTSADANAAGASSFHLDQPLQRIWRDINAVCSHAFWDWDVTCEITGREHLGLPLNHPLV